MCDLGYFLDLEELAGVVLNAAEHNQGYFFALFFQDVNNILGSDAVFAL
jgi:hypothetical protein